MNYKTKSINFKTILTAVLFTLTIISASTAQEMTPPKPIESSYLDKWVGTWVGENVYGGQPGKQTIVCAWDLNHQFLVVNVTGTNDNNPNFSYKGAGYYTLDKDGNTIGYWFDIFGAQGITHSKGKISGSKMENNVTAEGYTGIESAVFNGDNEVSMVSKGIYEFDGQKMPFEMNTSYKRK